ncbi:ABC transporter ATP-binding protein [Paraclostridium sordellii]|uniref:ABC transporter ATP-binding protein n=1 Tax=Paraclostridium sordellii TaxID=1505 RepID=UPI0005EA4A67|nr:ABC transporter ATP-binding protein [Paeniclostridium sordellii]MCR1850907.1 ABC transporter ATP-binding protein/permease [Paeniclostridium sordellii]CEN23883.1 ABC transporter ATP-binding protein [[Clostridium] sordellii] [Paeniclostridium sordellii]
MNNSKNLKRFFTIVFEKNKLILLLAFAIMLIISILNLFIPQLTKLILDEAIRLGNTNLLIKLVLLYLTISILSSLLNVILEYLYSKIRKKVSIKLKIKLLKHLSKLSGNYYTNIKTGNILSIIERDIYIVENFGAEILFSLIIDIFTACIALFFLVRMDFDLLLIVIILQMVLTLSQSKFTKIISSKTEEVRKVDGDVSNIVQEYVSNIMNVVISKSSFKFFKEYIKKEKVLISKYIKLDMIISSNISISRVLSSLITISIYGYGGIKIIKGKMSVGELIAFQQYTGMLIGPCISIIRSNTKIQQSLVSINRIFSILDEPIIIKHDNKGSRLKDDFNGDIVFDEVAFSYNEDKTLDSMNIKFEKGKMTALVGSSGCGKSTIANLLFRLWDIDEGKIMIDNIDIKDYNLKSLRQNISIVTQDLLLFDDSILNNLTLGNKDISRDYVEDICNRVGIFKFINELPNGFGTIIGEKGVKLSGGQKQRVAIARALISNSSIIIFDEATSALDNISQKTILENISDLLKDKTLIVIAHRLSTIKNADKIYVIDKGRVIEEGSHNKLILNENMYYNLINEQNEEFALV